MGGPVVGRRINNLDIGLNEKFEGEYRRVDDFEEVYRLLEESDQVAYSDTTGLPVSETDSSPREAARDYSDLVEILEAENGQWRDMRDAELEDVLTEGQRELVNSYSPEEDETGLVDIERLEKLDEEHRRRLDNLRDKVRETDINHYLRIKPVNKEKYEGTAYQLEVYQGEDLQLELQGLTPQEIDIGRKVDFIDSIR